MSDSHVELLEKCKSEKTDCWQDRKFDDKRKKQQPNSLKKRASSEDAVAESGGEQWESVTTEPPGWDQSKTIGCR